MVPCIFLARQVLACESISVSNRADTATKHLSDGVPTPMDDVDEITGAIEMLDLPETGRIDSGHIGRVLASFESQLVELNKTLRDDASHSVRRLRQECQATEEEVHELNTELDFVVKGETG